MRLTDKVEKKKKKWSRQTILSDYEDKEQEEQLASLCPLEYRVEVKETYTP